MGNNLHLRGAQNLRARFAKPVLQRLLMSAVGIWVCQKFHFNSGIPIDITRRNHQLLSHAHTIVYANDPGGNLTYVSPNCSWLLGYKQDEMIGQSFSKYVHPDDLPVCLEFLEKINETQSEQKGLVYRIIHNDGTIRWYMGNMVPIFGRKGRVRAYVSSSQDITEL